MAIRSSRLDLNVAGLNHSSAALVLLIFLFKKGLKHKLEQKNTGFLVDLTKRVELQGPDKQQLFLERLFSHLTKLTGKSKIEGSFYWGKRNLYKIKTK